MALIFADRVRVRARTVGTTTFILENAVAGFQSFSVIGSGNETYYSIVDNAGNWEIGKGIYDSDSTVETLRRVEIISSSNNNQIVNFPRGGKNVFTTIPASLAASLVGLESDPIFTASVASEISDTDILNWDTAYSWDNHAIAGYATETYVDTAISNIPEVDLTGLATETYVDTAISNIDIPEVDLTGLATETYVDTAISNIPEVDLTGLATETYVDTAISNIPEVDLTGYATETYVDTAISNIDIPEVDLTGYATETYVDTAISNIDIPEVDLTGYATETFVGTAISNLVDTAPTTLNTLNELAAALGDDANFATTVTTALGTKQATLVSGTNIKTINATSILGSGDITITAGTPTAITTTASSTNSNFKVSFLNTTSNSNGNYSLLQDSGTNFTYNPATNTLDSITLGSSVSYNSAPERSSSSTSRGDIYNEVNTSGATVVGYSTSASGWNDETALGYSVTSGRRSVGIGYSVRAGGNDNIVIGYQSRAGGQFDFPPNGNLILGNSVTVSPNAAGTIYLRAVGNTQFGPQETTVATQGFYVDPIQTGTASNILYYDTTTKQVTYGEPPAAETGEFTAPLVNSYGSTFFGDINTNPNFGGGGSPPTSSSTSTSLVVYDSEFDVTVSQFSGSRYLSLAELTSVGGNDSFFPAETFQLVFYYGLSNGSQLTIDRWTVSNVVNTGRNTNFSPGGQALTVNFVSGSYAQTIITNNPPPNGVSFFGFSVEEGGAGGSTASAKTDVDYFTTYVADISTIVQSDGSQNKHHPGNFTLGYANIGAPGGNVTKGWSAFEGADFTANGISFPLVNSVATDIGNQAAGSDIIQPFQGIFGSDQMYSNYARCIQLDVTKRYVISVSTTLLSGSSFSSSRYTSPGNISFNGNDTYDIRTAGTTVRSVLSKVFPQGTSGGLSPFTERIIIPVGTKYVLFRWTWQTDNGVNMTRDYNININVRRIS
jgi:hypothetical protein